jgi:polyphosphate kinase
VRFLSRDDWNARQRRWLHTYFHDELMPVLSRWAWIPHTRSRASSTRA